MLSKKTLAVLAGAATAVAVTLPATATHSWNNYHWARTSSSFTLQVVDSTTPAWDQQLADSISEWSRTTVLDLEITSADDGSRTRKRCTMVPGQVRVCNNSYGQNGWLGLASIGLDSNGHIDQGTAKMNDSYDWYFTPEEMNHVMCQEIGHTFGLGHTSEDGSSQQTCMDYSTDPNSQWPNNHDFQQLVDMYGHTDSYDSYDTGNGGGDPTPCHGGPRKCGSGAGGPPAGAGEPPPMGVRIHRGHNSEVWVAPRAGGGLWVHHVTLAPGAEGFIDDHEH